MPPPVVRGESARSLLSIEWDYPVHKPKESTSKGSVARSKRKALPRAEALRIIAGDDPRPLLVLRECKVCNGTDEALLKGGVDNEKTFLLARWFHCVKLPVDVMEEDHPFHEVFREAPVEHLFVSSLDGKHHDPLESETSRVELWESMQDLLAMEYVKNPKGPLKKITKLLDKLDRADQKLADLTAKREAILEKDGPDSPKLKRLGKDISKAQEEVKNLNEEVAEASTLELKRSRDAKKEAKTSDE